MAGRIPLHGLTILNPNWSGSPLRKSWRHYAAPWISESGPKPISTVIRHISLNKAYMAPAKDEKDEKQEV
jgi:hypothetical protein